MIIISQEKESAFVLENIKRIRILDNEIHVFDDLKSSEGACIGIYDTKERAIEVFDEILNSYIKAKKAQEANTIFGGMSFIPADTLYEMPEK